ncbi:hypothetical protein M0R45_001296 [Rubus argutus]|uniref:Helicase ATP-binding domain-containing protein n=1 Tax=Rubus argutus TaxID=59490 RepID=A0AAW1VM15_RUBAR
MEEEHVEMSEEMALRCLSRRKPLNTLVEREGLPINLKYLGLPQGATYQKDDSHHEITVPALHQRRIEPGEERLVSCLPDWAKAAFTGYDKLNRVQSKVCDTALHSVSPFCGRRNYQGCPPYHAPPHEKAASEPEREDCVGELIGHLSPQQIEETTIFVTIPEEWDVITRRSVFSSVTAIVKLVIVDGIHLIHDQNRGHIIEAIIARTVRQNDTTNKNDRIRLVALSFPFTGYEELALFLRVDLTEGLFYFDNSYRNSCISHQYIGVWKPCNSRLYPFLNHLCYKKVIAAGGKQVIIFVCSRKDTVNTACAIRSFEMAKHTMSTILKGGSGPIGNVKSNVLKQLLPYGLAIHHLGLDSNDRKEVVDLFQKGHIKVLVCTQTLAWGVNLRADTMLSHAEREGIIITGDKELRQYTYMMNEQFPIESHMVSKLADQLNTEIGLGSVRSAEEACNWFRYTYLYFCMMRNPLIYGVPADELKGDITLEKRCKEFIQAAVTILDANELVIYERESGYLEIREWRRISCYYSVCLGTTFEYKKGLASTMGDMDLFKLFLSSEEFKPVGLELDEDNKLKEKLLSNLSLLATGSLEDEHTAKINVFLQKLEKLSDMVYIQQSAERHLRALLQIVLQRRQFKLAQNALNLCKMVKKLIHQLPKLTISAHFKPINDILLWVELTLKPDFKWDDDAHGYVEPFWVIVEHNDCIIHHEYFLLKQQYINKNHTLNFTVSCPPLTELLELPPSSADAFEHPLYTKLYEGRINHFNRIQTQVFKALYESDDNILVAAPTGNGKTLCAEFAILRNHRENRPGMSVVYIAPSEALAKERFRDWEITFKHSGLNLEVFKLTGETATDLKLLEKGQIIISTPEKWDALSRSWKQRKGVYGLSLFIVDDLHLIGGHDGSILEVIVSRMRYIQCINAVNRMRIVALSTSVDDGEDIGRWIGAPKHALFNFLPDVRQMPVDIVLQEMDLPNVEISLTGINMAKLTCTSSCQEWQTMPCFCSY